MGCCPRRHRSWRAPDPALAGARSKTLGDPLMLGLKVSINGGEPVVCGADDLGVLMAGVHLVGQLGARTHHPRPTEPPDLWMRAGGMTSRARGESDEHINWIHHHALKVGDTVTIEIVHTDKPSNPVDRRPARERA